MVDIFSYDDFSFPKDFIFGSATAGHQIEGNNIHSSNWAWEMEKANADPSFEPSGLASNSYEMYDEDSALLKELGHHMYRMSIEWSRIEPIEGVFAEAEIDHYKKVFESLKSRGIKICLSLTHGAMPKWFREKDWLNKYENIVYFERYIEYVVPKIAEYIDMWLILNEPNGGRDPAQFDFKFNSVRYHARAYHIIKKYSDKPVSTAHMLVQQFPRRMEDKFDRTMRDFSDIVTNEYFFHAIRTGELVLPFRDGIYDKEIKDTCDFWAVNSYSRHLIDARVAGLWSGTYAHEKLQTMPEGFSRSIYPECMIHNLTRLTDKPVMITENGIAADDDDFRIVYITEYLRAIREAMDMGVNVIGYLHWSLIDNYEWGSFMPRYGLASVDRENGFKRTINKSGYFLRDIIENGGFSQDILRKYLTEMPRVQYGIAKREHILDNVNNNTVFMGGI